MDSSLILFIVLMISPSNTFPCEDHEGELATGEGELATGDAEDHSRDDIYVTPKYLYRYLVHAPRTRDMKRQWESRDGDVIEGGYSFLAPDGMIRSVRYTVTKTGGFQAVVSKVDPRTQNAPSRSASREERSSNFRVVVL